MSRPDYAALRGKAEAIYGGFMNVPAPTILAVCEDVRELVEALEQLAGVIDAAGLHNLSNGVQLGPTVWFVKASDAMDYSRALLAKHGRTP